MDDLTNTHNNNGQNLDINSQASNVIFIDTNLDNYQSLIPDSGNDAVYLINSDQNGIEQISEALAKYSELESVSIFSHGDEGLLELGNTHLSAGNLDSYQDELVTWGDALSETGDLLFYGCNVGADSQGLAFVNQIAEITRAEVAASDDLTGNLDLGGDWVLEVVTGKIETTTFTLSEYGNLLAISQQDVVNDITGDFNGDGKVDILRQEKGAWDNDSSNNARLLVSTGNDFNEIVLPESLSLKGDQTKLHVGDFNGDGKDDLLRQEYNSNRADILISTGTGFNRTSLSENFYLQGDLTNLYVGDFNGDGRDDILRQEKGAWDDWDSSWNAQILLSTGTNFSQQWLGTAMATSLKGDFTNLYVGDFNGDGRDDILRQEKAAWDNDYNNTADILISTGTGFNEHSLSENFYLQGDLTNLYVGDFNGDGRDDIFRQEKGAWDDWDSSWNAQILLSTGTNFSQQWLGTAMATSLKGDFTNLYVGDFNGDGRDDILRQEKAAWDNDNNNTADILISTGTGLNEYSLSESLSLKGDLTHLQVGDFTGDGKTDLVRQANQWNSYNDQYNAQLLASTGTNFNSINVSFNSEVTGNNTNNNTTNNNTESSVSGEGLKFNFTYDANVTAAQKTAFEYAGKAWANLLSDDVTVNLHVSMVNNSDLPSNTLGGAVPFFHQGTSYSDFRNKLGEDISSTDDQTAVNNLENHSEYSVIMADSSGIFMSGGTGSSGNASMLTTKSLNQVATTRANAKALGLIDANDSTLDGIIVMNNLQGTGVSWEYNYLNSLGSNEIDFTTVAIHEIGHALGFVSLVDGLTQENSNDIEMINSSATSLDLYRIRNNSSNRQLATRDSNFSINKNQTQIARFATGAEDIGTLSYGGVYNPNIYSDSYQGSHWKNEDNAGIMDPLLELSVRRGIAEVDLRALDVIGWDRKSSSNSNSTLWSQAQNKANTTGNINRNNDIDAMFQDWRWARGGRQNPLGQSGNIAQFLAQEGFFSVGAFRNSFDFSSVNGTQDVSETTPLDFARDNVSTIRENILSSRESDGGFDLDSLKQVQERKGTDSEDSIGNQRAIISAVTGSLSSNDVKDLNLDDLEELFPQAELVESVVKNIRA